MAHEQIARALFAAVENEVTRLLIDEIGSAQYWPEKVRQDAEEDLKEDPRSSIGHRSFIYYLYWQQKIEALSRNKSTLEMTPRGASFVFNIEKLLSLQAIRNDLAHPRPITIEDLALLIDVCRSLVQNGLGDSEVSEELIKVDAFKEPNTNKTLSPVNLVLNNLPHREYDDTGFVGRNRLIKQIVKDLKSKRAIHRFIWLTGIGGVGKTAIAREVTERLLWDSEPSFDLILWVSFKTHELTAFGSSVITDSLLSASQMIEKFPLLSGESGKSLADIFEELGQLETLIVFDNCETYPGDIQEIVDSNPPDSISFLFTSRRLGEFGRSAPVDRMEFDECQYFLAKLNRIYPSQDVTDLLSDTNKFATILDFIGMAPLGIKWLVRACNTGTSLEMAINNRASLLKYCVENVYLKLSTDAKRILHCLQLTRDPLSVGDLKVLFGNLNSEDLVEHIVDLARVGLVKSRNTEYRTVYVLDDTTRDFLIVTDQISVIERGELERSFKQAQRLLKWDPNITYSPFAVDGRDFEPLVQVSLRQLLRPPAYQKKSKEELISTAKQLVESAPKYWETHRVLGELYWGVGEATKCLELYQTAISICPKTHPFSLSRLHYLKSLKLTESDEAGALEEAKLAIDYNECNTTLLQYGRLLMFMKHFLEAETIFLKAIAGSKSDSEIFYSSNAMFDCYRRRCEDLKGQDCFDAAVKTLDYWLSTVSLSWDCPGKEIHEIVHHIIDVIQNSLILNLFIEDSEANKLETVRLITRIDNTLDGLGFKDWPQLESTRSFNRHNLVRDLIKVNTLVPSLPVSFVDKISFTADLIGLNDKKVTGNLKVWYPQKRFGFLVASVDGEFVDVYIHSANLVNRDDEAKLLNGTASITGILKKGTKKHPHLISVVVT